MITQFFKWEKILDSHFIKEDIKISSKHLKKSLISLVIRKVQ